MGGKDSKGLDLTSLANSLRSGGLLWSPELVNLPPDEEDPRGATRQAVLARAHKRRLIVNVLSISTVVVFAVLLLLFLLGIDRLLALKLMIYVAVTVFIVHYLFGTDYLQ
jgi:hypothetical protein